MAKIPDASALGERPDPRPVRGTPDISSVGRGYAQGTNIAMDAANRVAGGTSALAQGVGNAGDILEQADQRIRTRQDAVNRARAYLSFSKSANDELMRMQTEEDFSDLGTVEKYGKFLEDQKSKLLGSHGGGGDSSMILDEKLDEARYNFAAKASSISMEAQDKVVMDMMGGKINSLVMSTWNSPGSLAKQFQDLDKQIDDMAPAMRPGIEREMRTSGRERIAEAALGSLIGRGGIDAAERLLGTPGLSEVLGPQSQNRIQMQILAARQVISNAQNAGVAERTKLSAILGREPTQQELMSYVGLGPKQDTQSEEVADPTSPTGTRLVPRSLAMTPNALNPQVLAQYPAGKPSSGMNVEFNSDGTVKAITTGRAQGDQKPGAVPGLGTEGGNVVDKDLLSALSTRQSLQAITSKFKPEYQQIGTRAKMTWDSIREKGGANLDSDTKQELGDFTQYRATVGQNFSTTLKNLSGVAVNPTEFKRAESYLPNAGTGIFDGDSPTELKAKVDRFSEFTDKAIARLAYTKARGVKFDSIQLDDMPEIIKKRGNEIFKKLGEGGMSGDDLKNAVRTQISREFGFVGP